MVFLYIYFFLPVKISKFSFQGLMLKFRDVVYAHEEEEMENKYEELIQSNEAVKYPKFIAYLQSWTEYIGTTTKTGIFLVATSN